MPRGAPTWDRGVSDQYCKERLTTECMQQTRTAETFQKLREALQGGLWRGHTGARPELPEKRQYLFVFMPFIFGQCATYRHCDGEQGIEDDRQVRLGQARVITRFS